MAPRRIRIDWFVNSFARVLVALQVCALAFIFPGPPAFAAPIRSRVTEHLYHGVLAPRTVRFSAAATPASSNILVAKPFLTAHPRAYLAAKTAANRNPSATIATRPWPAAASITVNNGFATVTKQQQISKFGIAAEPPEPYVAAGSTVVAQTINSSLTYWSKTGTPLGGVDLNTFLGVPTGFFAGDPRIEYDSSSGRWFLSALGFDSASDSIEYLGVSQSSDPRGSWTIYGLPESTAILQDQPKLGVNDDKVVMTYDDFATTGWTGTQILIFDKSQLINSSFADYIYTGPDNTKFSVVPSQSLSSTTTEYLVFNNADPSLIQTQSSPTVGVIAVTGTPSGGNVGITEYDVAAISTKTPPTGTQPGGTVNTDDDRFTNAVWQNGTLWTGGTTGCTPTGDKSIQSCLHLVQVNTTGTTPSVVQAVDYGFNGYDLYYPAEGVDSSNNVVVTFGGSSSSLYPSVAAFGALAGVTLSTAVVPALLARGIDTYTGSRWGDYVSAATDPSDPTKVWISGMYSAAPTGNWGTGLARLSVP